MVIEFYGGHDFNWIQKFVSAIPNNKYYHKTIVFCLACCLHHQYRYKKQPTFKLTHKKLKLFCINRQTLKRYLEIFKQSKLINYSIQNKTAPIVTLLQVPNITNNKQINNKYTNQMSRKRHVSCRENDMFHVEKTTCLKKPRRNLPRNQGRKGRKEPRKEGTKEGREGRNQGRKEPRKEPSKDKILGPDKWVYPYSKGFYEQIDKELEKVQNKKRLED